MPTWSTSRTGASWRRKPVEAHMPLSSLALFAGVYAVAVASPGPGIFALVARVLARGTRGVPAFIAGFLVGDLLWFSIAATGFALLAQSFAALFIGIRYLGAAYLAYLAWRAWTAPVEPISGEPVQGESGLRLFRWGFGVDARQSEGRLVLPCAAADRDRSRASHAAWNDRDCCDHRRRSLHDANRLCRCRSPGSTSLRFGRRTAGSQSWGWHGDGWSSRRRRDAVKHIPVRGMA